MASVGHATLQIIPSTSGFGSALSKGVGPQVGAAGATSGKRFGGGMLSGLKGPLVGLGATFAAVKVGGYLKDATLAAERAASSAAITNKVIEATGGAAKISADGVSKLTESLSLKTGVDKTIIRDGANVLLTFKSIANEAGKNNAIFDRANAVALDMSATFKTDLKSSSTQLGKALEDPIKGVSALARVGVTFTDQEKEKIAALVESGDKMKAQKLVLAALEGQVGGTAEASADSSAKIANAMLLIKEKIGAVFLPLLDKAASFVVSTLVPAIDKIGPTFDRLGKLLSGAFGSGGGASGAMSKLSSAFRELQPTIQKVAALFASDVLPTIVRIVKMVGGQLLGVLKTLGSFLLGTVVPVFADLAKTAFSALLPSLKTLFATVQSDVIPAVQKLWESLRRLLAPVLVVAGFLLKLNVAILKVAFAILGVILPPLLKLVGFLVGVVFKTLALLIGWIANVVGWFTRIGEVPGIFSAAFGIVKAVVSKVMSFVRAVIVKNLSAARAVVSTVLKVVSVIFRTYLGIVKTVVSKVFGAIKAVISTALKVIAAVVRAQIRIVLGIWRGLQAVWSFVSGLFGRLRELFRSALSTIVSTVSDKVSSVIDFFRDIPGKIKSLFSGAVGWLKSAGEDIVRGLLDGAGSLLPSVGQFFIDKLPGWIQTPFKKALGINSPSKLFEGFGGNVVDGFTLGIEKKKGDSQKALSRMAAAPSSPKLTGGVAAQLAASAPATPVTVPLYLDGRKVAESVFEVGGREYGYGRREV